MYVYKYIYMQICIHVNIYIYSIYTYLLPWTYSLCYCPSFPLTFWCSICVLLFLSFPDACIHAEISDPKHV